MSSFNEAAVLRAQKYLERRGLTPQNEHAGAGNDGILLSTHQQSIIKIFNKRRGYRIERDVYWRLRHKRILSIQGHAVPQLCHVDDELGVIEMSIVEPPFVLDFAKAQLDVPWEETWPEDVMQERWDYWEGLFDPGQWPRVLAIVGELARKHGVYLLDLHQGNIAFGKS